MKKVFILAVFAIIFAGCEGKSVLLQSGPEFNDNKNNQSDDDLSDDLSDEVLTESEDDDSLIPDDDSPFTDHDSPVTDDDSPFTDYDSPVTDADVITCTEGELRCSSEDFDVEECDGGKWVTKEECGDGRICDDSVDPIVCADRICLAESTYCKMGDVYECASDELSEEMIEECTATQYCDDTKDPATCKDQVCTPDEVKCETNTLKICNENGSNETTKECGTGVCDISFQDCIFTGDMNLNLTTDNRTGRRGNVFNCTKNVTLVEFAQGLVFNGSKKLTWAIYEDTNNDKTYEKIFDKTETVSGSGKSNYSTGQISVDLKNGRKYLFFIMWEGDAGFVYGNIGTHPVDVGFGSSTNGYSGTFSASIENSLNSPDNSNFAYQQVFKYKE